MVLDGIDRNPGLYSCPLSKSVPLPSSPLACDYPMGPECLSLPTPSQIHTTVYIVPNCCDNQNWSVGHHKRRHWQVWELFDDESVCQGRSFPRGRVQKRKDWQALVCFSPCTLRAILLRTESGVWKDRLWTAWRQMTKTQGLVSLCRVSSDKADPRRPSISSSAASRVTTFVL